MIYAVMIYIALLLGRFGANGVELKKEANGDGKEISSVAGKILWNLATLVVIGFLVWKSELVRIQL